MVSSSPRRAQAVSVCPQQLLGQQWAPRVWLSHGPLPTSRWPSAALGDYISHITYGPIVTGQRPTAVARGVAIIGQKVVRPTGVLLADAVRVAEGSAYDLPRCRLQPRDMVFCRSGAGALRRKRFTVFDEAVPATVSCFVDLIRLRELNPYYVAAYLRSPDGWAQIDQRINGVGAPNVSFGDIRAIRIPLAPLEEQVAVERAWSRVREAHAKADLPEAEARLDSVVACLAARLGQG